MIVDLKDKIKTGSVATGNAGTIGTLVSAANVQVQEEAVAALTMLGFAQAPSQKVVLAILKEEPSAPVEQVIKLALKDYNIYLKQIMTTINMQYWLGANEHPRTANGQMVPRLCHKHPAPRQDLSLVQQGRPAYPN